MTVFDELNDPKACERHLARLRDAFPELGCGAFLVRDTSNIQWLTAFDDVFDEEAAHALYVCPDHAWLHTDSRYVTACENAARLKPLEVSAERETHAQFAAKRWGGRPMRFWASRTASRSPSTAACRRRSLTPVPGSPLWRPIALWWGCGR